MAADGHDEVSKEQREISRRRFLRHAGVAAAAVPAYAGLAEILGTQGASAATYKRNDDNAFFASHPKYKFVMVNHVTTNSFFTATIYGCQDACALTGTTFQWTGSQNSIVNQMVAAFNAGLAAALANSIGLEEAVPFAVVIGAMAVTREGVIPSLPRREDVLGFYRDRIMAPPPWFNKIS